MLRIHLILMWIWILDPHWKKMDSDSGYFFNIYCIFFTTQNFQIFCLIFLLIFMLKLNEPFRNQDTFIISLGLYLGLERKTFVFAVFCWYFSPWIRIQEAKILLIQLIRILTRFAKKAASLQLLETIKGKNWKEDVQCTLYSVPSFLKFHPLLIALYSVDSPV